LTKAVIDELIEREGGYVNHPNDKGGATKYGITEKTARAHSYFGNMIDMPRELAEQIYLEDYYIGTKIHLLTNHAIRDELLDSAVLHGPSQAIKWLQTAVNKLSDASLTVDGVLGYNSRTAVESFLVHNKKRNGDVVLVRALNCLQGEFMLSMPDKHSKPFIFGWLSNRVSL